MTVYGFLENVLRIGLCSLYSSCLNSHALIDRLDFDLDAAAKFAAVVKAVGREGV